MSAKHENVILYEYLSKISYRDGLRIQEDAQRLIKSYANGPGGYLYLLEHHPPIVGPIAGNQRS